jgi:molybdopterin molybdotransferase
MQSMPVETVRFEKAQRRILAEDVVCAENVPSFTRSTVDGYAVVAADTFGASPAMPALLRLAGEVEMGAIPDFCIHSGECAVVPTGGQLPPGADAMIMLEHTEPFPGGTVAFETSAAPGRHLIFAGDDAKAGTVVIPAGKQLLAQDIGVFAALGIVNISVRKRPVVSIISTGDELIDPSRAPQGAQIRDVNGPMLAAACTDAGCDVRLVDRVPDVPRILLERIEACARGSDVLLLSGGSSVGAKDAAADCLAELGEVLFHGLAVKPGKPTFAGIIGKSLVIGLPGHPAAAFFMFQLLVRPLLESILGQATVWHTVTLPLNTAVPSNGGREEYVAVRLVKGGAEPLMSKSGLISVLSRADGYIRVSRDAEGVSQGESVAVTLFS